MNDSIVGQLEHAQEIRHGIMTLCLRYCKASQPATLRKIRTQLGAWAVALRACLNYASADYLEHRLKTRLAPKRAAWLANHHDFPIGATEDKFRLISLAEAMEKHDPMVHQYLESLQPYHTDNEWLWYLHDMCNISKHESLVLAETRNVAAFSMLGPDGLTRHAPTQFGDKVMEGHGDDMAVHRLPWYHEPTGLFASGNGVWLLFRVERQDAPERISINVPKIIATWPQQVHEIITEFEGVWRQ